MIANPSYHGRDPNVPVRDLPPGTVATVGSLEYLAPIKRIAWGAVFAGVILAIGIQVLLNMLGTGIGASTIDPLRGNTPDADVLGMSAAVWWILSSLIALFVGGWTAARLAGIPRQVDGMLHGLLAWGLSTLVVFYFLGTVVGGLIGGTFNMISGGVA
ncbi:MAG: PhnA-like protein, partial [Gammaproteobacteria bacterium]